MSGMLPYIAIVVLLAFSALFSGAETAYASANRLRLSACATAEGAKRRDKLALWIYDRFDDALTAILVGNNLVNIAASSVATVIAMELLGESYAWVATVCITVLIITFGEILPKVVAASIPDATARAFAPALRLLMGVFSPVVFLVRKLTTRLSRYWENNRTDEAMTTDDLETILDTVEDEGIIEEERVDLLQNALDFDDIMAYEIITPRVDMLSIDIEDDISSIMDTLNGSPYSRIPVYEENIDNIIGILHLNRVYKRLVDEATLDETMVREMLLPPVFVHKTMTLDNVLSVMRRKKSHMVIVTDEYGGTMGCLTMEDVLEQIVGDIWDETDEVDPEFKKVGRDLYEADGDMRIEDLFEELEMDERDFEDDNATLGGWAIEMLGGYPKVGDAFQYKNLTITVKKRRNMRVTKLAVLVGEESES